MVDIVLKTVFPNWLTGDALFNLEPFASATWAINNTAKLNRLYFGAHSGSKLCSEYITAMLVNETLSDDSRSIIAEDIFFKYGAQWEKLYNAITADYNVFNTYSMTEDITRNSTDSTTKTSNETGSNTGTDKTVDDSSTTNSSNGTTSGQDGLYGFNSTESVPSDTQSGTSTQSSTINDNATSTRTLNLANTKASTGSDNTTENETVKSTKLGNVGARPQDLLLAEIEVRKQNFYEQVFNDIDKVLTLAFNDVCRI